MTNHKLYIAKAYAKSNDRLVCEMAFNLNEDQNIEDAYGCALRDLAKLGTTDDCWEDHETVREWQRTMTPAEKMSPLGSKARELMYVRVYPEDEVIAIEDAAAKAKSDLMSVAEAAEALGVTRTRVNQLIYAGKLDAVKVGRNWVVSKASVEARKH